MDDGAGDGAEDHGQQNVHPAEEEASGGHELDVAHAETAAAGGGPEQEEQPADGNHADEIAQPAAKVGGEADEAKEEDGQIEAVGDGEGAPVDDGYAH